MASRGWLAVAAAIAFASPGAALHARDASATESPQEGNLSPELSEKERELAAIAEQIRALKDNQAAKEGEQQRLTDVVETLERRVRQARLELDHTTVSIEEIRIRIRQTADEIVRLRQKQERLRRQLSDVLRLLALLDRQSLLEVILEHASFAGFLGNQQALTRLQGRATTLLTTTRDLKQAKEAKEEELRKRRTELEQLAKLQAAQRASLQAEEQKSRQILGTATLEAARVATRLAEAEEARREVQQAIFVLKNAGLQLSLAEATAYAVRAGSATGVRPALLLAVLKVESNLGTNVGSGRYPGDVHPDHREAFLRVTEKLGLDPRITPVSARPTTYEGWGGALGPGQILPGIWERVEPEVANLLGKPLPSPFELLDAFTATAVLLRNAGAASGNEYEAVNRYFAGPNWQRFTWYGDRVLAVAREYERPK